MGFFIYRIVFVQTYVHFFNVPKKTIKAVLLCSRNTKNYIYYPINQPPVHLPLCLNSYPPYLTHLRTGGWLNKNKKLNGS